MPAIAPDAPISGICESGADQAVRESASSRAKQVEDKEADVAERVLDIVAEHPEKQHVAAEMEDVAMQERVGDVGEILRNEDIFRRKLGHVEHDRRDVAEAEDGGLD